MPTNHGSIEFLKFPNPAYKTDNTQPRFIKKWLRDSWARRKILALQQAIAAIIVPTASTANPQMDGTAAPGVSTDYARADHVHPHDSSKADAATTYTKTEVNNLIPTVPTNVSAFTNDAGYITSSAVPSASTASPAMDGTASAGSSAAWARGDHVHPSDTAKQDALSAAQLAAVDSGITSDNLAVNDPSVLCTATRIVPTLDNASHADIWKGCYYYKIGHRVRIHIGVMGLTSGQDTNLFTLPVGYRPYATEANTCLGSGMTNYIRIKVSAAGLVHVSANATSGLGYIEFDAFA